MMGIINVKKLVKNFKEINAVDSISFEVEKGEIFAFLGPNGAGKSTTIKILTTLLKKTSGEALVNGFDVDKNSDDVRRSIGIVFQDSSLDDELTAWENMEFHGALYKVPKKIRRERTKKLLEIVELWDRKDSLVKTFSGGMKRRLEIARGLLHHPKVFFLDEPTIGLDPQTRSHIWSYIEKLNKKEGITIFFTTHYMEEADLVSDRVAIIDHGKVIKIGTPVQLKKEAEVDTLEKAFLHFTGYDIREEAASSLDKMRMIRRKIK
ncbi:MAG: ATP-binding cassette domain-containing protein [Candidatus Moranbacteria bacterium]|nr:ATP-binding cassette domain-containing protein [Candidatus Moranbacteria bacterium]